MQRWRKTNVKQEKGKEREKKKTGSDKNWRWNNRLWMHKLSAKLKKKENEKSNFIENIWSDACITMRHETWHCQMWDLLESTIHDGITNIDRTSVHKNYNWQTKKKYRLKKIKSTLLRDDRFLCFFFFFYIFTLTMNKPEKTNFWSRHLPNKWLLSILTKSLPQAIFHPNSNSYSLDPLSGANCFAYEKKLRSNDHWTVNNM